MDSTSIQPRKFRWGIQKTNYYNIDAELAKAFQADCEEFLQKFKERKDFSFTTFSRLWKEQNFIHVFKDIDYLLLLQEFIGNCFYVIKRYLHSSDLYIQTGAVYMLYAIYYKQPIKGWIKVRLTRSEAEKLTEIIETHKKNSCLDPAFIYYKMRMDDVFQYCAISKPLGLDAKSLRRVDLSSYDVDIKTPKDGGVLENFKNLIETEPDLANLEETDEEYQKLAMKYKEKYGNLYIFPSKVGENLKRVYNQVFHNEEEKESEEDTLRLTKNRAVSNIYATYRGERKIITALDLQEASTSKE